MSAARKFYLLNILILLILAAYPLIGGVRMAAFHIANGILEPEQYVKYVVPYTAICVSLLFFALVQPLLHKMKRLALPAGLGLTYALFFGAERFFEAMPIHTSGMTLIDAATLATDGAAATATADAWQAALCIVSPIMREQSLTYASLDSFYYVIGDSAYKAHYYLISLVLITMVGGLIYGIAKMLREGGGSRMKPQLLRGIATASLVALCIFANTTAFFRQAAPIQTPLASFLTGLFFVALGAAAGVYIGSYLLAKGETVGIGLPVLLSLVFTVLLYAGEAVMMKGKLYRFGAGWFFDGLPRVALAPVDTLIILLSGGLAWLILNLARKREKWPGKRMTMITIALCAALAALGPVIALTARSSGDDEVLGCYVFAESIYTNPLSSSPELVDLPYVYAFDESAFLIAADAEGGGIQSYAVVYCHTPVGTDEFSAKMDSLVSTSFDTTSFDSTSFTLLDLARFKERFLLAVASDAGGQEYGLYRLDDEIWLAELRDGGIESIFRVQKTEAMTLTDIRRVIEGSRNPGL